MRLSDAAYALYQAGKYQELQALPLDQLLDNDSLREVSGNRFTYVPPAASASVMTGPMDARDGVLEQTLKDAVVIPGGYVIARETLLSLYGENDSPVCPFTRAPIAADQIVELPQISLGVILWKFEREQQLADQQAVASPALLGSTSAIRDRLSSAHREDGKADLTVLVNLSRIRLKINARPELFNELFKHIFTGKDNNKGDNQLRGYNGYKGPAWALVWQADRLAIELECCIPRGSLSEDDMNLILAEMIKPLALPEQGEEDLAQVAAVKLNDISSREYQPIFSDENLGVLLVAQCCIQFIEYMRRLRAERCPDDIHEDKIIGVRDNSLTPRIVRRGVVMLGAQHSTSSVAVSSVPAAQQIVSSTLPSQHTRPGTQAASSHTATLATFSTHSQRTDHTATMSATQSASQLIGTAGATTGRKRKA